MSNTVVMNRSEQKAGYYRLHSAEMAKSGKAYRVRIKLAVLSHYGGGCAVCGIDDHNLLTIDHIGGSGNEHRKVTGVGVNFYNWLIQNDFPGGFQVLCWNHNRLKYVNERSFSLIGGKAEVSRLCNARVKRLVINQYGGQCQFCGETNIDVLTIDHVNGGGRRHLRSIGRKAGSSFYRWLRDNGFPNGFRVLCFNCNCGEMVGG